MEVVDYRLLLTHDVRTYPAGDSMSTEQQPIAFSIPDAAKAIGISRAGMYNLLGDKKIAARKIGSRTVIPAEELRRFVNSQPMYQAGGAN